MHNMHTTFTRHVFFEVRTSKKVSSETRKSPWYAGFTKCLVNVCAPQKKCLVKVVSLVRTSFSRCLVKPIPCTTTCTTNCTTEAKKKNTSLLVLLPTFYRMFCSRCYCFPMCSSPLSLLTYSCVSTLQMQWLSSSPNILAQHGESQLTLQCDKKKTKRLSNSI